VISVAFPEVSVLVIVPLTVQPGPIMVMAFPEMVPVPDWLRLGAEQVN